MSWPNAGDPFYLANQNDNNARRGYYNVNGTPTMECDGAECGTTQGAISAAINNRLTLSSPLWMRLESHAAGTEIMVNCDVVSETNISGNYVFQTMVLNRYTSLPNSPNGQPNHYSALLKIAPTSTGQPFSATAYDTVHYNFSIPLNPTWSAADLDVACFVQNNDTKEFIQAARVEVPLDFPNVVMTSYNVADINGNLDGRVDPGETGRMIVTLHDLAPFFAANQVVGTLSTTDPLITVTNPLVNFPDIATGDSVNNTGNPFQFTVDPTLQPHQVTFTVTVTAQPYNFQATFPVTFMVGRPNLLVVNDDINGLYGSYYDSILDSLGRVHDVWVQTQMGSVSATELGYYPTLIWFTGIDDVVTLSETEQGMITNYLNAGGKLLLSSQNLGDLWGQSTFYHDVIHAEHLQSSVVGAYTLTGVPDDPISNGTTLMLVGSSGAGNANSSASLNVISPAQGIYTYNANSEFGALRCEIGSAGRLVYFSFAFEAISGLGTSTSRYQVLDNCLYWLEEEVGVKPSPGPQQLPSRLEISGLYPNPFNPSTEISFELPVSGLTEVAIYNLQGKLVESTFKGQMNAGYHHLIWNANSHQSGIYFVRLQQGDQSKTIKAVYLK